MRATLIAWMLVALTGLGEARADTHYVSLLKFFPSGKCSSLILNYELMKHSFFGGEITELKIRNNKGEVIEVLSTFINKERDQWAIVGSKRDEKVIFCLHASGIGQGSVDRQTLDRK